MTHLRSQEAHLQPSVRPVGGAKASKPAVLVFTLGNPGAELRVGLAQAGLKLGHGGHCSTNVTNHCCCLRRAHISTRASTRLSRPISPVSRRVCGYLLCRRVSALLLFLWRRTAPTGCRDSSVLGWGNNVRGGATSSPEKDTETHSSRNASVSGLSLHVPAFIQHWSAQRSQWEQQGFSTLTENHLFQLEIGSSRRGGSGTFERQKFPLRHPSHEPNMHNGVRKKHKTSDRVTRLKQVQMTNTPGLRGKGAPCGGTQQRAL